MITLNLRCMDYKYSYNADYDFDNSLLLDESIIILTERHIRKLEELVPLEYGIIYPGLSLRKGYDSKSSRENFLELLNNKKISYQIVRLENTRRSKLKHS